MCWKMTNLVNRYLDVVPRENKNLRNLEIDLKSFDKRPGEMPGDLYSQ